jgi:hypothetical protein
MHSRNHRDWRAGIMRDDQRRYEVHAEIDVAVADRLRLGNPRLGEDIAHIGKTLRAQQFLGGILRGDADARVFCETDRGCLERTLRGE